jgi:hypothetical protein
MDIDNRLLMQHSLQYNAGGTPMVRIACLAPAGSAQCTPPTSPRIPARTLAAVRDINDTAAVSASRAGMKGIRDYLDMKLAEAVF